MVDVRVGDEWRCDGNTYRVDEVYPDRVRTKWLGDQSSDPGLFDMGADNLTQFAELTWALPRVGDTWFDGCGNSRRVVESNHPRPIGDGLATVGCLGVTDRRSGWRPAPRSPMIATSTLANPEPQVGDVWRHKNWDGTTDSQCPHGGARITAIDGDDVSMTGISGYYSLGELVANEGWRRVSAAAKPAVVTCQCGNQWEAGAMSECDSCCQPAPVDKADAAAHPERYRWRARGGTRAAGRMNTDKAWSFGVQIGVEWRLDFEKLWTWVPSSDVLRDCDPLPLEDIGDRDVKPENASVSYAQHAAMLKAQASGENLSQFAAGFGLPRAPYETDEELRARLELVAKRGLRLPASRVDWAIGHAEAPKCWRCVGKGLVQGTCDKCQPAPPPPPPTWRDLFHEVAANPPAYARIRTAKNNGKPVELWVRAVANYFEEATGAIAFVDESVTGAVEHARRDVAARVDAEYRRLGGEVW